MSRQMNSCKAFSCSTESPTLIFPSAGCVRDLRLNGRYMPLDSQLRDWVSQVSVQGLSVGCSSDSCKKNHCKPPFTCVDLWRVHECRYTLIHRYVTFKKVLKNDRDSRKTLHYIKAHISITTQAVFR